MALFHFVNRCKLVTRQPIFSCENGNNGNQHQETGPNYHCKHTDQIIRGHIENCWQNVNFINFSQHKRDFLLRFLTCLSNPEQMNTPESQSINNGEMWVPEDPPCNFGVCWSGSWFFNVHDNGCNRALTNKFDQYLSNCSCPASTYMAPLDPTPR